MGVKGLLPLLQPITIPVQLEQYRGLTAAVDAMAFLHRGLFCDDVKAIAKYQHSDKLQKIREKETARLGERQKEKRRK